MGDAVGNSPLHKYADRLLSIKPRVDYSYSKRKYSWLSYLYSKKYYGKTKAWCLKKFYKHVHPV